MTAKAKLEKLVVGKKYLVGPEREEMFCYKGPFSDMHYFINWHMEVGGEIELICIKSEDISFDKDYIEDKSGKYLGKVVKSPKLLVRKGQQNQLANLFERAVKIIEGKIKGDSAEYEIEKLHELLLYTELSKTLESTI